MTVRVEDPEDNVYLEKMIGAFLGDLNSNIVYDLKPDHDREVVDGEGEDENAHAWLTGVDDIMGKWEVAGNQGTCRPAVGGRVGRKAVEVRDLFF